jgi:hypothetical protein
MIRNQPDGNTRRIRHVAIVARGCCIRVVASVSVIGAQTIAGDEQQACADMPSASSRVLDFWTISAGADGAPIVENQHRRGRCRTRR